MSALGAVAGDYGRFSRGLEATVGHLSQAADHIGNGELADGLLSLGQAGARLDSATHSRALTSELGGRQVATAELDEIGNQFAATTHGILLQVTGAGVPDMGGVVDAINGSISRLSAVDAIENPAAHGAATIEALTGVHV